MWEVRRGIRRGRKVLTRSCITTNINPLSLGRVLHDAQHWANDHWQHIRVDGSGPPRGPGILPDNYGLSVEGLQVRQRELSPSLALDSVT